MKDELKSSTAGLRAVLGRVAVAFFLGLSFTCICFVLLRGSESFLPSSAVRLLTRIVWWPVAITCGFDPRDLFCLLPGILFGFLFHWLVAFVLLWWLKTTRRAANSRMPLR